MEGSLNKKFPSFIGSAAHLADKLLFEASTKVYFLHLAEKAYLTCLQTFPFFRWKHQGVKNKWPKTGEKKWIGVP